MVGLADVSGTWVRGAVIGRLPKTLNAPVVNFECSLTSLTTTNTHFAERLLLEQRQLRFRAQYARCMRIECTLQCADCHAMYQGAHASTSVTMNRRLPDTHETETAVLHFVVPVLRRLFQFSSVHFYSLLSLQISHLNITCVLGR